MSSYSPRHLLIASIGIVLGAGALILFVPRRHAQPVFAAVILLFYSFTFASTAKEMDELIARYGDSVSRIVAFLGRHQVKANDRLIMCGNMAYYQDGHRFTPIDQFFLDWHRNFDLSDVALLQIEALGHYDVRIARNPDQVRTWMRPGDHLLTATRFTDLDLMGFENPYYIYALRKPLTVNPQPLYTTDITADLAYSLPRRFRPARRTFQMLGRPKNLCPGQYRATLYTAPGTSNAISAEAVRSDSGAILTKRDTDASGVTALEFSTSGEGPVQFRLTGPGVAGFRFKFASIQYLSPFVTPTSPASTTGQFVTESFVAKPGAASPTDSELRLDCYFNSLNGQATAPMRTVRYGDPLQVLGWISGPRSEPQGERWICLKPAQGAAYYLRTQSTEGDSFRALATNPPPPNLYRLTAVQVESNRKVFCVSYTQLTIQDSKP